MKKVERADTDNAHAFYLCDVVRGILGWHRPAAPCHALIVPGTVVG